MAIMEEEATSASGGSLAPKILCAGIIVLDEVFQVERFPEPGEKARAHRFCTVKAACAANAAIAVARLGGRPALAGPLGDDRNGDQVLAALARERVDCTGCRRLAGTVTPLSAIFIDPRGERMIATHHDDQLAAAGPTRPAPPPARGRAGRCHQRPRPIRRAP